MNERKAIWKILILLPLAKTDFSVCNKLEAEDCLSSTVPHSKVSYVWFRFNGIGVGTLRLMLFD